MTERGRGLLRWLARPAVAVPLLVALGALVRWPFVVGRVQPPWDADTYGYFGYADLIAHGHFATGGATPRGPGYPLFVLLADLLPGSRSLDVVWVQHLLGIALGATAFVAGRRWFGPLTGWLAGLLLVTSPLLFTVEDDLLPDLLLGVVAFALAALLVEVVRRPGDQVRAWAPALAGGLAAFAGLVKPVGIVLLVALPAAVLIAQWPWRLRARRLAIAAAGAAVVLVPWTAGPVLGHGALPFRQADVTLFNRLFEVDGRPVPDSSSHGKIVRAEQLRIWSEGTGERLHVAAFYALRSQVGLSDAAADASMRSLARQAIEADPVGYLWHTVTNARRFLVDANPGGEMPPGYLYRAGASSTGIVQTAWRRGAGLASDWWILTLNGFAALLVLGLGTPVQRRVTGVLLAVWLPVAFATAATHGGLPRYSAQLLAITYLATVAGAVMGGRAVIDAIRARHARDVPAPGRRRATELTSP